MKRTHRSSSVRPAGRRRPLWPWAVAAIGLALAVAAVIAWRWNAGEPEPPAVTIDQHRFLVELAVDPSTRKRGLSNRASLPADQGMLFMFPSPGELEFWMKGCLIDLDIAFISADRRIVTIHTMKVEPLDRPEDRLKLYPSDGPVQFALEVAGGEFARRGIRVGDVVTFSPAVEKAIPRPD